jgi:hypothetical protein
MIIQTVREKVKLHWKWTRSAMSIASSHGDTPLLAAIHYTVVSEKNAATSARSRVHGILGKLARIIFP